jgi:hypothetical protein
MMFALPMQIKELMSDFEPRWDVAGGWAMI